MPKKFIVPPVKDYIPAQHSQMPMAAIGEGQMMDMIQRDSPKFSKWTQESGGFHFDEKLRKFVPDMPEKSFMDKLKDTPRDALNSMAEYERVNPIGSALGFMGNVVAGQTARGFKQAETLGRVFGGAVDVLPRFEIADNLAKVNDLPKLFQGKTLGEVLDHPELFNNYPDLRDVKVQKMLPTMDNYERGGEFLLDEQGNTILRVNGNQTPEAIKSSLLHEVQHEIQRREGFNQGTKEHAQDYMRNPGEREARTVQDRIPMTPQQRTGVPFMDHFMNQYDRMRS